MRRMRLGYEIHEIGNDSVYGKGNKDKPFGKSGIHLLNGGPCPDGYDFVLGLATSHRQDSG